ncbi:hypothetical protein DFH09DRAFT_1077724 [Mycena vulgaris]|nr:hypothetical protein DFH09DRAFT_1077724 [Mycena vulgaris]
MAHFNSVPQFGVLPAADLNDFYLTAGCPIPRLSQVMSDVHAGWDDLHAAHAVGSMTRVREIASWPGSQSGYTTSTPFRGCPRTFEPRRQRRLSMPKFKAELDQPPATPSDPKSPAWAICTHLTPSGAIPGPRRSEFGAAQPPGIARVSKLWCTLAGGVYLALCVGPPSRGIVNGGSILSRRVPDRLRTRGSLHDRRRQRSRDRVSRRRRRRSRSVGAHLQTYIFGLRVLRTDAGSLSQSGVILNPMTQIVSEILTLTLDVCVRGARLRALQGGRTSGNSRRGHGDFELRFTKKREPEEGVKSLFLWNDNADQPASIQREMAQFIEEAILASVLRLHIKLDNMAIVKKNNLKMMRTGGVTDHFARKKEVPGDGLSLATALAPDIPVPLPQHNAEIGAVFNATLNPYDLDDASILSLIRFYNEDFGIILTDTTPTRCQKISDWLTVL